MSRSASANLLRGGVLSLARLLTGIVRVKVLAMALGVEGVGIYSILVQLQLTAMAAVSMSLAVPIINLGRPSFAAGDIVKAGQVAGTALAVLLVNSAILLILAAIFGGNLLAELGAGSGNHLVWPIVIAIVVGTFSAAFWEGLSYLSDRFDIYVRVGVIGAIADMLFVAAGAALFGLEGAVIGIACGTVAMFIAYSVTLAADDGARAVLRNLAVRLQILPGLFAYSALMFSTVALTNLGLTFLRARVLTEAGATANGYLQTATALAAYILAFVMTGFWGHLYALAAAEGDTPRVRRELGSSLELGLLIAFTGCGAAAVLAPFLIPLFYSQQFTPAAGQLVAYLPGELCFQLLSMLIAYQLTVSRRRLYLSLNFGYVGLLVAAGLLFIPTLGGTGYVLAHNLASLAMIVAAGIAAWRSGQVGGRFLLTAAVMVVLLASICAALLTLWGNGYSPAHTLPALLPFAVSGLVVLLRMWRERNQPAALPPSETVR